jgi:transcriptional regulator with XRE-family HTH domain
MAADPKRDRRAAEAQQARGEHAMRRVSSPWVKSLGELLREARSDRYTIEELATKARVSAGRISQIERGLANPSFETLWRLTTALEVPLGSLFPSNGPAKQMVVRANERKRLEFPKDKLVYEMLTPNLQGNLEIFMLEVPPGYDGAKRPPLTHRGEKFVYIQEGEIESHIGDRCRILKTGDSITFDPSEPHFICNPSTVRAVVIAVVTPPAF